MTVFSAACAPASAAPEAGAAHAGAAQTEAARAAVRVEAHSPELLAVGLVRGDRMSIRLSRVLDNAPVHDAGLAVVLRGATYPAVAEADGSYSLTAPDLTLPGEAAVEFHVTLGGEQASLKGMLKVATAAAEEPVDRGGSRQMWWWALNFSVCIGFLWLFSRRKKAAQD